MSAQVAAQGRLAVERVGPRTDVVTRLARYPLRFMFTYSATPANGAKPAEHDEEVGAMWAFALTFGGGLVGGDSVRFDVEVAARASLVLTTQSSTKVYKQRRVGEAPTEQIVTAKVARGGLLCVTPHPVTCFRDACFHQAQRFLLEEGASLVYVDWITSGRTAGHNEEWDLLEFRNDTSVHIAGAPVFLDNVRLEQGGQSIKERMGDVNVLATMVLIGLASAPVVSALPAKSGAVGIGLDLSRARLIDEAGYVVRIAGNTVEQVEVLLAEILAPLAPRIGGRVYGWG
mmetsp:Transcript_19368/g.62048  ORF Transcript_19368/g.62048 Transcript_19368/m.62048 type:complete len:287 (-) Transcript_19368:362-1222(-)